MVTVLLYHYVVAHTIRLGPHIRKWTIEGHIKNCTDVVYWCIFVSVEHDQTVIAHTRPLSVSGTHQAHLLARLFINSFIACAVDRRTKLSSLPSMSAYVPRPLIFLPLLLPLRCC